jgi:aspartate aminotransferase
MRYADCMKRLGTETAFEVLARAKGLEAQGRKIIHLEIGEPDFDTPSNIIEAAVSALKKGFTHYGPSAGLPAFREAIAEDISKSRDIKVTPSMVVVTPGAKPIMFFLIMALAGPGDEVIYPNPGFPIYESVINFVGAKAVPIQLREENDFRLDVNELKKLVTSKTRLMIINTPQNPTGGILTKDDLKAIAEIAVKNDIMVLSDEVYCRIIYGGKHESITQFPGMMERTVLLDGFSKTYAMTGWRLGYGVMREDLAVQIAKLQTNANSCTASFTQMAGIEALRGPQDDANKMVAEFKKRRDVIVDGLNGIKGVTCKKPNGAFYVFPNVSKLGIDTKKLETEIMDKAGVAVLSGTAFGEYGKGYLRLSYANSIPNIKEAVSNIKKYVENL